MADFEDCPDPDNDVHDLKARNPTQGQTTEMSGQFLFPDHLTDGEGVIELDDVSRMNRFLFAFLDRLRTY